MYMHVEVVEFHKAGYEADAVMSDESSIISSEMPSDSMSQSTNSSLSFLPPPSVVTTPSDIILIGSDSEEDEFECTDSG